MTNEIIILATAIMDLFFVLFLFQLGPEAVTAAMAANLILVSSLGGKIISLFGYQTNAANVFYASIFLGLNLLALGYGKKQAQNAVWVSFSVLVFFVLMAEFTVRTIGLPVSDAANQAIASVFRAAPRLAFASMVAYLAAANLNIWIFARMKSSIWLRNITSQAAAELVDSVLFFAIAFFMVIPFPLLVETMVAGFVVKMLVAVISTPFLYAEGMISPETEARLQ